MAWLAIVVITLFAVVLMYRLFVIGRRYYQLRQQRELAQQRLIQVCDHYRQQLAVENAVLSAPASETLCRSLNILCKNFLKQLVQQNSNISQPSIEHILTSTGIEWSQLLNTGLAPYYPCWPFKNRHSLSTRTLNILAQGAYRPAQSLPVDLLQQELKTWITRVNPQQLAEIDQTNIATNPDRMEETLPC